LEIIFSIIRTKKLTQ